MEAVIELLSNPEQADIVIQSIASYVIYIYPGIISIYLYNFFVATTTKNTQAFIIKSFAISYLYNLLVETSVSMVSCVNEKLAKNSVLYNIVLIFVALILPYIFYKIKMSKLFSCVCEILGISTSVTSVPFELLGDKEEKYTCLKIYIKDEPYVYIGYLGEYEYEDGHDKYVILTGYRKYYINSKAKEKLIFSYSADSYNEKVFIQYKDIKFIEKIGEKRAKELYRNEDKK